MICSYTRPFTLFEDSLVLAQGELISTAMMNYYLQECGEVGFASGFEQCMMHVLNLIRFTKEPQFN